MMDYTLPVAKRTRLKEAEMYRKLHDEIRNNRKKIDKDLLDGGSVGVQDENGRNSKENCGVSPVILDDSEDDMVFLDEADEGYFKEGKEFVNLDDSDNDDDRVGFDVDSRLGAIKGVDFVRVKTEEGTENESFNDFNRDINVGKSSRDLKSGRKRKGRTRLLQSRRKVSESSNGGVFDGEWNGNVEMMSSGIYHEDDGVDWTGRKSNEVARWTKLPSKSRGKNKDGYGGDDHICYVSEDIEESESSSSGEEEEEEGEEDSDEEIEEVKEEPGDGDYEVELSVNSGVKALRDGEEEKGDEEEEDADDDDDREQSEVGLKRKKVCGIEILCNSNNGKIDNEDIDKDYSAYMAKHARSHNDSESVKKRMKLGTVSRLAKEKLDGDSDDKNDNGTYAAGDVVKKAQPWKGGSRGVNGGSADDNDEKTCKAGQTTRSQKRINGPRKGSRKENVLDICVGKPNKRKWTEEEEEKDANDDNGEQGEVGLKRKKFME